MSDTFDVTIDPDNQTLADMEDFEAYVGVPFHEAVKPRPVFGENGERVFDEDGRPVTEVRLSSKALTALVWISKRAENPNFTIEDARRVKVGSLNLVTREDSSRGNG